MQTIRSLLKRLLTPVWIVVGILGLVVLWFATAYPRGMLVACMDVARGQYVIREHGLPDHRVSFGYARLLATKYNVHVWNGGCMVGPTDDLYDAGYNSVSVPAITARVGPGIFAECRQLAEQAWQDEHRSAKAWDTGKFTQEMLEWLEESHKDSDRKLWLFARACWRQAWPALSDDWGRPAVEVVERFADGHATRDQVLRYADPPGFYHTGSPPNDVSSRGARRAAWHAPNTAADTPQPWSVEAVRAKKAELAGLLRDIFPDPVLPPPTFDPRLRTPSILTLASAAYEKRKLPEGTLDPARLKALAAALDAAGCKDKELLGHLRSPGPHVRGCWPVDLVLGQPGSHAGGSK